MPTDSQPTMESGTQRVMAYCHDSVGLGHFHRTLVICDRVRRFNPASTFLLATGTPYVPIFDLPQGVDYVKLPALAKPGRQTYRGKYLTTSIDRILCCRESVLLSATQSFDPEVFLVDKAPTGVCGELLPTLRWLRRHRPKTRIVFGMRDIEDDAASTIEQWNASGAIAALEECYDEIWVYGMRSVFDVTTEYCLPDEVVEKLRFVGYVVQDPCCHSARNRRRNVLVTVGGGTDGAPVLRAYLQAVDRIAASGVASTIVGGPDLPPDAARELHRATERASHVEWLDFVPCMSCRIRRASVIVSMGGYNTLCEVVSNGKPAVVVPRTSPRLEQAIRARLWSQRAALDVIPPDELSPALLAEHVIRRLQDGPQSCRADLDFGGLDRVCERFKTFWNRETCHAAAVRV